MGWEVMCVNRSKKTSRPWDRSREDPGASAGLVAGDGSSPSGQCGVGFSLLDMCWTQCG